MPCCVAFGPIYKPPVPPGRMDLTDAIVKGEVDTEEPEPSVTNPSPATLESLIGSVAATVQLSPRARNSVVGFVSLGFVLLLATIDIGCRIVCDRRLWYILATCAGLRTLSALGIASHGLAPCPAL